MNITILTYGSRGDVQPFVALAQGLQKGGHNVTLAAPNRFSLLASQSGIKFAPLAGDPAEISLRLNEAGTNVYRIAKSMRSYVLGIAPQVVSQVIEASASADLLIHSFLFTTGGHSLARQLGIPDVSIQTFPMFAPTGNYPNVGFPSLGRVGNYFSHWFATQVFWYGGNTGFKSIEMLMPDTFPRKLSWPFRGNHPSPLLIACSPRVIPPDPRWPSNVHLSGYLFLDEPGFRPSAGLVDFLATGEAPICVSFGSMLNPKSEQIQAVVLEAILKRGERVVILTGWGEGQPTGLQEKVFQLESVPHSWLLPRCKAIIHHGGAGTTAAGLHAGIPNIILPHAADQPFWGRRVQTLGAGPAPVPLQKLTIGRLSIALDSLDNPAILSAAQKIGRLIRQENGVETAIRLVERERASFTLKNVKL
ncbi:MAG TPA: glycosyltransferase [Anaerolineales bacterium]|jgi:UDP:flavonoid glycosyltransferase YjiC (YdhE family)